MTAGDFVELLNHPTQEFIDKIAETIYLYKGGICPEEYEEVVGMPQKDWATDAPWDSRPGLELCEHERDEYRVQAKAVIEYIKHIFMKTGKAEAVKEQEDE